jgi:hypothetical protein
MANFADDIASTFADILTGAVSFREGLSNVLGNLGGNLIQSGIGEVFKGLGIPGYAGGTDYAPGGLAWVGERGKELMHVPRGAQIIPNHELGGLGGGNVTATINVNVAGARGNAEIMAMVEAGVGRGLRAYDHALPDRVARISADPYLRG